MLRFAFSKTCVALSLSRAVVLRDKKDSCGSHTQGPAGSDAGRSTAKVGHESVGGALPTVVSPLPTAGVIPSKSSAGNNQTASGAPDALAEAYAGFKDFLDPEKISAKPVATEAEKASLRQIGKEINVKLPEGVLERRGNTTTTVTFWKEALVAGKGLSDSEKTEMTVRDFAASAFKVYPFPVREDDSLALVQKILKFVDASLFRGVLEVHIQKRLAEKSLKAATAQFGCPVLCLPHRVPTFGAQKHVVRERDCSSKGGDGESGVGRVVESITSSFRTKGPERRLPLPLVIGGESGAGKTFFSALAPEYVCEGYGLKPDKMKRKALTVYACPSDTYMSVYGKPLDALKKVDAALQDAKKKDGVDHPELRAARTEAAANFLEALVRQTLDWDDTLVLPDDEKYECFFIVVDELSSEIALSRSLLEGGGEEGREKLLGFTKGLADTAQLICCGTGNPRLVIDRCADAGEYRSIVMGPSTLLFEWLLQTGGVRDAAAETLMGSPLLSAVVENRRAGKYAAQVVLDNLGDTTKGSEAEQLQKFRLL